MKNRFNVLLGSLAVFAMSQASHAASGTWTGSTDGNWHTAGNWTGGVPNAAADVATFNSTSSNATVSIGATATTVDKINFSGVSTAAYTLTGTAASFTNMVMSTNGGGVFIDSVVTTNQDLSGIPIIRPGMDDTINFSNQGSGWLKLGTFQAQNETGTLGTVVFKPGANGNIEIVSGKLINNGGTSGVKKIAIIMDDVGTLKVAATGNYNGASADGNSVGIRQGTLQAAVIKNSGTSSSLGAGGRIQFGSAATTNTATLDYYGATDTTNRDFQIVDNNTAVFKVSGGAETNLTITSSITQSGSASGGGKLTKDGIGILTLSGSNSHSAQTLISAGRLVVGHANALGTAGTFNSRTTISNGGTLELDTSVANEFLDIISNNTGAVVVNRATSGVGITQAVGNTYLGSNSTLNVTTGANVTSGTATLETSQILLVSNSVGTSTLNSDSAAISVTGSVSNYVASNKTLALAGSHVESVISGVISNGTGSNGTISLTKSGSGTWTLTNENSYTGDTAIVEGSLVIGSTGSIANSSTIQIASGANFDVSAVASFTVGSSQTLAGSGTVTGDIGIDGTLDIGSSPGTMNFAGDLTLGLNSTSDFEINGFASGNFDLARAETLGTQTVIFNSGILNLFFQSGFNTAGSVKIFDFDAYDGTGFSAVNVTGLADGYTASFDSANGMVTVIPEPSICLLGSLSALALLRRRR